MVPHLNLSTPMTTRFDLQAIDDALDTIPSYGDVHASHGDTLLIIWNIMLTLAVLYLGRRLTFVAMVGARPVVANKGQVLTFNEIPFVPFEVGAVALAIMTTAAVTYILWKWVIQCRERNRALLPERIYMATERGASIPTTTPGTEAKDNSSQTFVSLCQSGACGSDFAQLRDDNPVSAK